MANMLQSSQNVATEAPSYYTNYLSNLASAGQQAQQQAQYVGAQPLQQQAFCKVAATQGQYQPYFQTGAGYVGCAANKNIAGAATPYLQAGTGSSPLAAMQPYAQTAMATGGKCVAQGYICKGIQTSALSAANPYLQAAAAKGGLCAANPYLQTAAGNNPALMAQCYMNPYIQTAVQGMSDIAQRNIQQNLSPAATAAAVGSGQFGSQRGAQVLGQINRQAQQDLNTQIAQMLSSGYGQALQAAGQQQALLGQLGGTAGNLSQQQQALLAQLGTTAGGLTQQQAQNLISGGTNLGQLQSTANQIAAGLGGTAASAQQAQNAANLQAAATASCAAYRCAYAKINAGLNMGSLGTAGQNAQLACINALATLGAQQRCMAQAQQLFPLTTLSSLAGLMQGYTIPTTTKTTLCMSPFSAAGAIGSAGLGLITPKYDKNGNPIEGSTPLANIKKTFGSLFGTGKGGGGGGNNNSGCCSSDCGSCCSSDCGSCCSSDCGSCCSSGCCSTGCDICCSGCWGCDSCYCCSYCWCCGCASGGSVDAKARGFVGCASTKNRGGLPSKG